MIIFLKYFKYDHYNKIIDHKTYYVRTQWIYPN